MFRVNVALDTNVATTEAFEANVKSAEQKIIVPVMSLLATKLLQAGMEASVATDASDIKQLEVLSTQDNSVALSLIPSSLPIEVKPDKAMEASELLEATNQDGVYDTGDAIDATADTEALDDNQLRDNLPRHL